MVVGYLTEAGQVTSDLVNVGLERKVTKVIDALLEVSSLTETDKEKLSNYSTENITKNVKEIVEAVKKNPELRESLLTKIPKSEEFPYHEIFEDFMKQLMTGPIKIDSAIRYLYV